MIPVYATRADGWPLCPMCHEDELYSFFAWDGEGEKPPMQAWIDAGLRCYRCQWDSTGEKPLNWPMPARVVAATSVELVYPHVTLTIDTTVLSRALEGFGTALDDACKGMMGIAGASPWARDIAEDAARNAELMERAQFLTGKAAEEIRVLAAQSPLCFADFVQTLANQYPPGGTPAQPAPVVAPAPTPPAPKLPARITERYGVRFCSDCSLMEEYCRCGQRSVDTPSKDARAESDLGRRINDCKGK